MSTDPLFRPEILEVKRTQGLGTVLLAPRLSHRVFAIVAGLAVVAVGSMMGLGHYTRRARVSGLLVAEQGVVQVFAPRSGVVTEIAVSEGQSVRKGERLLVISSELQSSALGDTRSEIVRRLTTRRDSLAAQRREIERLEQQQARFLTDRIDGLQSEEKQLQDEMRAQWRRYVLARKSEARQRQLYRGKYISEEQLQSAENLRLEQQVRIRALSRQRLTTERDRITLQGERADLPLKTDSTLADLDRSIASVEQELASAEADRELVVPAPEAGVVTAVQAERGGRPNPSVPLLSIVPTGAKLQAQLFSPSRAVGFLHTGQKVLLRYQAYPYQKFGHAEGVLHELSRSAINPSELPAQLHGLTSVIGANEPVYRITVELARQTIRAYGADVPLQPGMLLDADVLVEKRKLYEWILDPLFTITGKWGT